MSDQTQYLKEIEGMRTPECIKSHQADYKHHAWQDYTLEELSWWVRLLTKRSTHRTDPAKVQKDLYDAKNYQAMYDERLKHVQGEIKA